MGFVRAAFWVLIFFTAIRLVGRLLRASFHFEVITPQSCGNRAQPPGGGPGGRAAAEMAQDPMCGAWVAIEHAVTMNTGATTHFFCSGQCLENYRKKLNG